MTNETQINVWEGNFGTYHIPPEVHAKVKRWRKDGWPYKQDKGRDNFLGWVWRQEEAERAKVCLSKLDAGRFNHG